MSTTTTEVIARKVRKGSKVIVIVEMPGRDPIVMGGNRAARANFVLVCTPLEGHGLPVDGRPADMSYAREPWVEGCRVDARSSVADRVRYGYRHHLATDAIVIRDETGGA